jgi:hypothetical protein
MLNLFRWILGLPVKEVADGIAKYKETEQAPVMAQNDINKEESKSDSLFKSGWRPFIGWELGICFGLYSIPVVAVGSSVWVYDCITTMTIAPYPIDLSTIWHIMQTMLGMSALRTVDKIFGKNS